MVLAGFSGFGSHYEFKMQDINNPDVTLYLHTHGIEDDIPYGYGISCVDKRHDVSRMEEYLELPSKGDDKWYFADIDNSDRTVSAECYYRDYTDTYTDIDGNSAVITVRTYKTFGVEEGALLFDPATEEYHLFNIHTLGYGNPSLLQDFLFIEGGITVIHPDEEWLITEERYYGDCLILEECQAIGDESVSTV